jgi:hypothetical protein
MSFRDGRLSNNAIIRCFLCGSRYRPGGPPWRCASQMSRNFHETSRGNHLRSTWKNCGLNVKQFGNQLTELEGEKVRLPRPMLCPRPRSCAMVASNFIRPEKTYR